MPRMMFQTLSRRLPAADLSLLVIITVGLMPFVMCESTLDPGLTPRFLLWGTALGVVLCSFLVQAAAGDLLVDSILPHRTVFLLFLGYLLSCLVSLLQTTNLGEGLYDCAKVFLSVLFLPVSIIILSRNGNAILNLAKVTVLSATALSLIGFYQYATADAPNAARHFAMTGTMGNKNLLASALFLMLPYCLYVVVGFRGLWRLAGVCAAGAILVVVLLSRTRAVCLALLVSGALTTALSLLGTRRSGIGLSDRLRRSLLLGACQILVVVLILGGAVGWAYLRSHSQMQLASSLLDTESIMNRLWMWKKTLAMIGDHWLWGVGMGNWKVVVPSYGIPGGFSSDWFQTIFCVRPHNDFLWVFSETGAIGFCFYVSVFAVSLGYLVRLVCRGAAGDDGVLALLMFFGITGYLVISMFCFPRERVLHSVMLLLMLAVAHVVYQRRFPGPAGREHRVLGTFLVLSLCVLPVVIALGCMRFNAERHMRRALFARAAQDYRTVIAELDHAYSRFATLDPTSTPLMWYRGEGCFLSGMYSEALENYKQALADHPYHVHVLNNLATCYQKMGSREQAVHHYEELLQIAPRFAEATCNLAAVYFNAGEYEKAWDTLTRCELASQNALVERYRRIVAGKLETCGLPATTEGAAHQDLSVPDTTPHAADTRLRPLHRLWSATYGRYFYSIHAEERDAFLACRDQTWIYEGIDSYVFAEDCVPGLSPVHRFYAPEFRAYFYTMEPGEVQRLCESPEGRWQDEGVAFFAFPPGAQPAEASAVYRFWSGSLLYHVFTIDQKERDNLQTRYSDVWTYEGIVWYACR